MVPRIFKIFETKLLTKRSGLHRKLYFNGPLTQSVEYLPFKQRVAGSSPARPTRQRFKFASPSSSQVQDTGLSRRRQGFESPWGRQIYQRPPGFSWRPFLFPLKYCWGHKGIKNHPDPLCHLQAEARIFSRSLFSGVQFKILRALALLAIN